VRVVVENKVAPSFSGHGVVFIPVFKGAKLLKIDQHIPELWSQKWRTVLLQRTMYMNNYINCMLLSMSPPGATANYVHGCHN